MKRTKTEGFHTALFEFKLKGTKQKGASLERPTRTLLDSEEEAVVVESLVRGECEENLAGSVRRCAAVHLAGVGGHSTAHAKSGLFRVVSV